jgi:hypothetical protein
MNPNIPPIISLIISINPINPSVGNAVTGCLVPFGVFGFISSD